ncbi:hypothetical protein [Pantoea sp. KPR_PJ]|uniref:hypothetical protein n=1 Tax=Pantoea sp. KPR_PJ TaxID=2738375 RepID=UPI0035299FB3
MNGYRLAYGRLRSLYPSTLYHLMAHAMVGAVTAYAAGNGALAGGIARDGAVTQASKLPPRIKR